MESATAVILTVDPISNSVVESGEIVYDPEPDCTDTDTGNARVGFPMFVALGENATSVESPVTRICSLKTDSLSASYSLVIELFRLAGVSVESLNSKVIPATASLVGGPAPYLDP